jgi:hypothetical protein
MRKVYSWTNLEIGEALEFNTFEEFKKARTSAIAYAYGTRSKKRRDPDAVVICFRVEMNPDGQGGRIYRIAPE